MGGGIKNGGGVVKKLNLTNQRPRNYLTQKTEDIRWTDRQTKNQLTGRLCSTSRSLQKYKKKCANRCFCFMIRSIKYENKKVHDYIDSVERIDANRSQNLGLNDANRGRKSLKWCKFWLEVTKN